MTDKFARKMPIPRTKRERKLLFLLIFVCYFCKWPHSLLSLKYSASHYMQDLGLPILISLSRELLQGTLLNWVSQQGTIGNRNMFALNWPTLRGTLHAILLSWLWKCNYGRGRNFCYDGTSFPYQNTYACVNKLRVGCVFISERRHGLYKLLHDLTKFISWISF
jgi:hypothetical protein